MTKKILVLAGIVIVIIVFAYYTLEYSISDPEMSILCLFGTTVSMIGFIVAVNWFNRIKFDNE